MVVDKDDRISPVTDRFAEDFRGVGEGLISRSPENFAEVDESLSMVEKNYADRLLRQHLHFRPDQGKNIFGGGDRPITEWLVGKASTEFEHRGKLRCLCRSYSRNLL